MSKRALCIVCCAPVAEGRGQWAVELLLNTASLPGGSGQWEACCTLVHCHTALGQWAVELNQYTSTLPQRPEAVGNGTPSVDCLSALGQWAVVPLRYTATLLWSSGQRDFFCTLAHCWRAVGSGIPSLQCHTTGELGSWGAGSNGQWNLFWEQWAVGLVLYTAALLGTKWAVDLLRDTDGEQWALISFKYTATPVGSTG